MPGGLDGLSSRGRWRVALKALEGTLCVSDELLCGVLVMTSFAHALPWSVLHLQASKIEQLVDGGGGGTTTTN